MADHTKNCARSFSNLVRLKFICCALCLSFTPAHADTPYSGNIHGALGLNTIPSARMEPQGTIRLGVSTLDPYVHGFLGFQLAEPLNITLRQSAEISNINEDPDRLYPGVDLRLRLLEESRSRPAVVVGLQSAAGHKRMSGEYLALSKRFKAFDFTAGLGWGRYGTAAHFNNPLKSVHEHFGESRDLDGEMPAGVHNWFTGEHIGLFAGIEYFTPVRGLSLKLDYGADRFEAEQSAFNYDVPSPWSAGFSYQALDWMNVSIAAQGSDKIMGRLSFHGHAPFWKDSHDSIKPSTPYMRPFRTGIAYPAAMETAAAGNGQILYNAKYHDYTASADLMLRQNISSPSQIGRAAIHMSNHAGPATEELVITPGFQGLRGGNVHIMRKDIENYIGFHQGSAEEIWQNTNFSPRRYDGPLYAEEKPRADGFLDALSFTIDNQISLAEEDSGVLYRSSFLLGSRGPSIFGLLDTGGAIRLNLKDNIHRLQKFRPRKQNPVRSDVDLFADRTANLENLYMNFTHSFGSEIHLSLLNGYLEEMYGGYGGEILYRPFRSRFSVGAELWNAFRREPYTGFSLGYSGQSVLTGHINVWYDSSRYDATLYGKMGRYLGKDHGATVGLEKRFKNGVVLDGFITLTDNADFDLFGGTTHNHNGLRLTLPLGGYKYMPQNSEIHVRAEPFGRDIGQTLEKPVSLYDMTEPFSYEHMAKHWTRIVP